jgi:hypothetical protein
MAETQSVHMHASVALLNNYVLRLGSQICHQTFPCPFISWSYVYLFLLLGTIGWLILCLLLLLILLPPSQLS